MTAQETYASMLREQIAPRLRALGFQGSGGVYRLPDEREWRQLGFQKDRYSTAVTRAVRFSTFLASSSLSKRNVSVPPGTRTTSFPASLEILSTSRRGRARGMGSSVAGVPETRG